MCVDSWCLTSTHCPSSSLWLSPRPRPLPLPPSPRPPPPRPPPSPRRRKSPYSALPPPDDRRSSSNRLPRSGLPRSGRPAGGGREAGFSSKYPSSASMASYSSPNSFAQPPPTRGASSFLRRSPYAARRKEMARDARADCVRHFRGAAVFVPRRRRATGATGRSAVAIAAIPVARLGSFEW